MAESSAALRVMFEPRLRVFLSSAGRPRSQEGAGYSLALCATCVERQFAFKHAFLLNLMLTWQRRDQITYYLLDGSKDPSIPEWLAAHLPTVWASGHIVVVRQPMRWHASICKNIAAMMAYERLGPAGVYVNLDGDNVLTMSFLLDIMHQAEDIVPASAISATSDVARRLTSVAGVASLQEYVRRIRWPSHAVMSHRNPDVPSTTGRITMSLLLFVLLRGYDQGMKPSGFQDIDLMKRAALYTGRQLVKRWGAEITGTALSNVDGGTAHLGRKAAQQTTYT